MQADFYILASANPQDRYMVLCKLIEKAYAHNHQVYIHTQDSQQANIINELLWSFRDVSFIPHTMVNETHPDSQMPVCIGYEDKPGHFSDLLINLHPQVPQFYKQFKRIIELIPESKIERQTGRAHYRFYREQGWKLFIHPI